MEVPPLTADAGYRHADTGCGYRGTAILLVLRRYRRSEETGLVILATSVLAGRVFDVTTAISYSGNADAGRPCEVGPGPAASPQPIERWLQHAFRAGRISRR